MFQPSQNVPTIVPYPFNERIRPQITHTTNHLKPGSGSLAWELSIVVPVGCADMIGTVLGKYVLQHMGDGGPRLKHKLGDFSVICSQVILLFYCQNTPVRDTRNWHSLLVLLTQC